MRIFILLSLALLLGGCQSFNEMLPDEDSSVFEPPPLDLPDTSSVVETTVDGVIYVTVFNPQDGRKNWHQLITAFCWAVRDTPDATLMLKITQGDLASYYSELMTLLAQLTPFACRVVVMFPRLLATTSWLVRRIFSANS